MDERCIIAKEGWNNFEYTISPIGQLRVIKKNIRVN